MPKSQFLDPNELRKSGKIKFKDIPVNTYSKTVEEESKNYTKRDFMRIYRDMAIIREFETMLYEIKTKNNYNGVEYSNPGPAHLSTGQEASAVGQAYILDKDDFIFGSHRSHGEILAKGLSCIEKMDEKELYSIMEGFFGGEILRVVENLRNNSGDVKELAVLVWRSCRDFRLNHGHNRGLGGSMHAFFTPFGIAEQQVSGSGPSRSAARCIKR